MHNRFWRKLDDHLPLVEFTYNNSYHSSIQMTPYEALFEAPCRTRICWTEAEEKQLAKLDVVEETEREIKEIRENMRVVQDRQRHY